MIVFLLIGVLAVTLMMGIPIAFCIGLATMVALAVQGTPFTEIPRNMFAGLNSFPLLSMPLFILAGDIMLRGRITKMLLDVSDLAVGRIVGGLGHVNILASILFAGITGMATADTTALGSVLIPAMVEKGYERDYSTAITIASSIIGPIIPPSLTFVIYALAVGRVSIGGLFLAGAVPGLLMGIGLMVVHYFISRKRQYEKREHAIPLAQALTILKEGFLALLMPVIIIGGILTGVFTATEAAGVASLYAMVVCLFIFHTITWRDLPDIMLNMVKVSAMIALILGTSKGFSWVLTTQNVPQIIGGALTGLTDSPLVFLMLVNIILLVIGCVVDTYPAILIFAPILHPIALSYGIHPLHFGVVMCVNLLIGLNTPPVGTGLFLGVAIGKVSLEDLVKAVMPFNLVEIAVLLALTYVPALSLWLPTTAGFR
ncbi:MAG: TRAP transporter large permease [Limnochordia bacterium]|jgi:tripartite ATP-independent transporter DctM subunit